jgi:DNA adenine methylase
VNNSSVKRQSASKVLTSEVTTSQAFNTFEEQLSMNSLKDSAKLVKPALKWAGGKRWLVPTLLEIWKSHSQRRLAEPFVGSMSVVLGLQPQKAILNDRNIHLINFCIWLQKGLQIELPMQNEQETYYEFRKRFNELALGGQAYTLEAAQLFYYLNRTGYNGLCRFNNKGEFNVPFGRYKVINYVKDFSAYVPVLSNWQFISGDFYEMPIEPDDFIYADPPYDVEFTKYGKDDFTWRDQERLGEWLAKHSGPVVLSNQATERILNLYESLGLSIKILDAPRRISCTGDRKSAKEVLAYKNI